MYRTFVVFAVGFLLLSGCAISRPVVPIKAVTDHGEALLLHSYSVASDLSEKSITLDLAFEADQCELYVNRTYDFYWNRKVVVGRTVFRIVYANDDILPPLPRENTYARPCREGDAVVVDVPLLSESLDHYRTLSAAEKPEIDIILVPDSVIWRLCALKTVKCALKEIF